MDNIKKSSQRFFRAKPTPKKYFLVDIIYNERFVCTMKIENVPQYWDTVELEKHIVERMPSLRGKDFEIHFYDN